MVGEGSINLQGGKTYKLKDLCIEPKTWQVRGGMHQDLMEREAREQRGVEGGRERGADIVGMCGGGDEPSGGGGDHEQEG